MSIIAIISQKGGAGKRRWPFTSPAAAERTGQISLAIDTDPQATASQWSEWRKGPPPDVIDSATSRVAVKVAAAICNWKARYGGLEVSEVKRLRALEDER